MRRDWFSRAVLPRFLLLAGAENEGGEGGGGGGGSPPPPPPPPPPAGAGGEPWYGKDVDEAGQQYIAKNGFKNWSDVLKTAQHQETFMGVPADHLLKLPTDRNQENMVAVLQSIGAHKDAAGYGIKESAERGIDGPQVAAFGDLAAKIGLLPFQTEALLQFVGDGFVAGQAAQASEQEAKFADGEKAIKTLFGDAFDQKVDAIDALITEIGGDAMKDYLFRSNKGNDPAFAAFMDEIVKRVGERPSLPGEKGRDTHISGKLSPAEAAAKLTTFEADNKAALADKGHVDHKALVEQRLKLIEMANP